MQLERNPTADPSVPIFSTPSFGDLTDTLYVCTTATNRAGEKPVRVFDNSGRGCAELRWGYALEEDGFRLEETRRVSEDQPMSSHFRSLTQRVTLMLLRRKGCIKVADVYHRLRRRCFSEHVYRHGVKPR